MPMPELDTRNEHQKALDEQWAAQPMLPLPGVVPDETPRPLEAFLRPRQPVAVMGVVENGVIRLLDSTVKLPEHARVIVVASNAP